MIFPEDWRHIQKGEIEAILQEDAEDYCKEWFNFHLKEEGHKCSMCRKRVQEVISDYVICFHSNGLLWNENEGGDTNLLELAREITGIDNLSFNQVLDGVYSGKVCKYCINPNSGNTYSEKDVDLAHTIIVVVENNWFSKLGVMEIVESVSHKNQETGQLEMISFEWAVRDDLLFKKWEKAGFPLKWRNSEKN